ncbi:l-ascorbate oxidase [Phlyctema vagabunda]|uniref:L-ascorbate oxidase n=1 Tax=Phlyctema vagabunda TaxID=108571 RepID=A0ABR4PDF8_9HELO
MSDYKDEPVARDNSSLDDVEMQEREDDSSEEQTHRLLSDGEATDSGEIYYKVESHLRTGWAIVLSLFLAALVFVGMVLFAKYVVIPDNRSAQVSDNLQHGLGSFRRPANDYILDPKWNINGGPTVREYHWTITDIVANPDGIFRPMLTINGQFPGPLIECNDGDTLVIEVDNQSINSTSIHFHGLFQNGTNFMDGTAGITQCPIAPRRKFRYEFKISAQSGTYYYHGHQAVQVADGLYGPVVIHSRSERSLQKIPYASDRVVMLQDYYYDLSSGLLKESLSPGSENSPIPNGALINGLNKRDCSTVDARLCDNSTAVLPSMDLTADANHRLRFINVGAFAWFQVGIDEHEFAITEVDGTDVEPAPDTRLMIGPAQRYSLVIRTNVTTGESFWLRARMVTHCWGEPELPGPGLDEVKAIIYYNKTKRTANKLISPPTSRAWAQGIEVTCRDMNTTSYIPLPFQPPPGIADKSYFLRANIEIGDWRLERGFFNKSTLRPQLQSPTLHRIIDGFSTGNNTFISQQDVSGVNAVSFNQKNDFVIQHSGIQVIDLIIQNFDEGNHPLHLHGHKMWVLGQGHGMFPGYASLGLQEEGRGLLSPPTKSLDNLIRRDVTTVEGFGWIALRFVADNAGIWAFHCHVAWHSEGGMAMQFLSRVDLAKDWSIPEANRELCEVDIAELEKGAAPKDEIWYGFGIGG